MIRNNTYAHSKQDEIITPPHVLIQRTDACLLIMMNTL